MRKGILGHKVGMTQVFTKSGKLIPVTAISVEPNVVTQIKTTLRDGYDSVQLGFSTKREKLANKPAKGHVAKANTSPKRFFREVKGVDINAYELGQSIDVTLFSEGELVDVTGTSKGKGFQGSIKRHGQSIGPMSHGSRFHRKPGSMGSVRPKHVLKGKKLPGHMGVETITIQNLEVVKVDLDNNIILIKGNVPGPRKALIFIGTAVKKPGVVNEVEELLSYEIVEEEIKVNKKELNLEDTSDEKLSDGINNEQKNQEGSIALKVDDSEKKDN